MVINCFVNRNLSLGVVLGYFPASRLYKKKEAKKAVQQIFFAPHNKLATSPPPPLPIYKILGVQLLPLIVSLID